MDTNNKFPFTTTEFISIIEASAKAQVTLMKWGTLELHFGKPTEKTLPKNPADNEISDDQHEKSTETTLIDDELRLRQDQIEHMQVENPALAEKLIAEGELEDDEFDDDEE